MLLFLPVNCNKFSQDHLSQEYIYSIENNDNYIWQYDVLGSPCPSTSLCKKP